MRIPAKFTDADLRDAHAAADVVASEMFRPYLPGRLLPVLVARLRDDLARTLDMDLPPLPRRPPVRAAKLTELTSHEFAALWGAVDALVERFTPCMNDPELPRQLANFREGLMAERAERTAISEELTLKARASF
jgi:hypothetical protein